MDKRGTIVIPPTYDDVYAFSRGLAPVELEGKWGYADKAGKLAIPIQYQFVQMFSEGVASVVLEGKAYYIKPDGSPAFPATFDSAMPFCGGVASVETFHITESPDPRPSACRSTWVKGKHGKIDHEGPRQGSMHYEKAPRFRISKLDVAGATGSWREPVPGRESSAFQWALVHQ